MPKTAGGVLAAAVWLLEGCESQSLSLSGIWIRGSLDYVNAFQLEATAREVTGIYVESFLWYPPDTLRVWGTSAGTVFDLRIERPTGTAVTFVGQQVSNNQLQGTWTWAPDSSMTLTFVRQPPNW